MKRSPDRVGGGVMLGRWINEEGYALMGAAFEVHREMGGGLSEEIYQESLEWELGLQEIRFSSKEELKVFYKGHLLNKRYIPDLHVEWKRFILSEYITHK